MNLMTAFTAETAYGSYGRRDRIHVRRGIIGCGTGFTVGLDEKGNIHYAGENRWGQKQAAEWQDLLSVFCGPDYILGLCRDGTVLSAGRSHDHGIDTQSWACVTVISCGQTHAAALIGNGQVMTSGSNRYGQCQTSSWSDMVDVCCGKRFTVGLRQDGRLKMAGGTKLLHQAVENWEQVSGVFSDEEGHHIYAITYGEGRLMSTAHLPAKAKRWRNLVYVSASARGIVGITAQGQILSTHQEDVKKAGLMGKDYTACAAGPAHLALLCRSGQVITLGNNDYGQCSTRRWGALFDSFEDFSTRRREAERKKERWEKFYQQRLTEAARHSRRIVCGERLTACIQADGHVSCTAGLRHVKGWKDVCALSCGSAHLLALHPDGTVSAEGNNVNGCCHVKDWRHIKDIQTGKYHSLGLCEDGHVEFAGWNLHGQGYVSEWRDIRLLRCTDTYTVGVARDGHIVVSGKQLPFDVEKLDMTEWRDLVDLVLSEHHMVGLRKDGSVVAVGDHTCEPRDENGCLTAYQTWRGVRSIAAGDGFTVALCYGGHVLAEGKNQFGQCDTWEWKNVVSVSCGRTFTAALTADGHVLTAGQHLSGKGQSLTPDEVGHAVMDWEKAESTGYEPFHTQWMTDILALKCGREHLATVDRYGQVMAEGLDLDGQCASASAFVLFRDLNQLDGFGIFTYSADRADKESAPAEAQEDFTENHETAGEIKETSGQAGDSPVYIGQVNRTFKCLENLRRFHQLCSDRITCSDTEIMLINMDGRWMRLPLEPQATATLMQEVPTHPEAVLVSCRHRTAAVDRQGNAGIYNSKVGVWETLPIRMDTSNGAVNGIALGKDHTVILLKDGTVHAYGENEDGRCDTNAWKNIVAVAVGDRHTVGLTEDGRVLATGSRNREDAAKTHLYTLRNNPCHTGLWTDVKHIVCAQEMTCGLRHDGTVLAVGKNTYGQCRTDSWRHVIDVAASGTHTVGLKQDGTVVATGKNDHGECEVSSWKQIIAIGAFGGMTVGLTADGHVVSAGRRKGMLALPAAVYAMKICGNRQLFVLSDGRFATVYDEEEKATVLPVEFSLYTPSLSFGTMTRVDADLPWDMMARELQGCVGLSLRQCYYQTDDHAVSVMDSLGKLSSDILKAGNCRWVSAGLHHAVTVTADGKLTAFGKVPEAQSVSTMETLILESKDGMKVSQEDAKGFRAVVCGVNHTLAITEEDCVVAVGDHSCGQCDTKDWQEVMMVACGHRHSVALTRDHRVLAVGDQTFGQCDVDHWQDIVMIACGEYHTVGLTSNGQVIAVGDNRWGQCHITQTQPVVSVTCLPEATICINADGSVSAYGGTGEFKDRISKLSDVVAVFAREYRLIALTSDGRLIRVN